MAKYLWLPLLLQACGPAGGELLLDPTAWVEAPDVRHRPDSVDCDPAGWRVELEGMEVETDLCPYIVLTQPLLLDVRAGRDIQILAWHNDLVSPEPAEGHLLLTVGEAVLLDWNEPIPSNAAVASERVSLPTPLRAGDAVVLHVHNHGANTWNLNEVALAE